MSRIHFDLIGVRRLIEHCAAAPKHHRQYGKKGKPKPALMLVGDVGVYLMSNGDPGLLVPPDPADPNQSKTKSFVVYARECDPTKMDFDDWWEAKNRLFGGDDGSEHILLTELNAALATYPPNMTELIIDLTADAISLVMFKPKTIAESPA